MNQEPTIYTRICWHGLEGAIEHSRWYRGTAGTEQAKIACEIRWPTMKFWIERARSSAMPELTIQDLIEGKGLPMKHSWHCLRCGYDWVGGDNPERCPKCLSHYWDTPPKNTGAKTHVKRNP